MENKVFTISIFLAILLFLSLGAVADEKSNEQIKWQVISSGGTSGSSTNFELTGTAGQTATGGGSSENYGLGQGYWQDFGGAVPCDCMPGDANNTFSYNILDVTYIINYLYKGGPTPTPYAVCSGDANASCSINILDVSYLINYLYKGGPSPLTCEEWADSCGPPRK